MFDILKPVQAYQEMAKVTPAIIQRRGAYAHHPLVRPNYTFGRGHREKIAKDIGANPQTITNDSQIYANAHAWLCGEHWIRQNFAAMKDKPSVHLTGVRALERDGVQCWDDYEFKYQVHVPNIVKTATPKKATARMELADVPRIPKKVPPEAPRTPAVEREKPAAVEEKTVAPSVAAADADLGPVVEALQSFFVALHRVHDQHAKAIGRMLEQEKELAEAREENDLLQEMAADLERQLVEVRKNGKSDQGKVPQAKPNEKAPLWDLPAKSTGYEVPFVYEKDFLKEFRKRLPKERERIAKALKLLHPHRRVKSLHTTKPEFADVLVPAGGFMSRAGDYRFGWRKEDDRLVVYTLWHRGHMPNYSEA